ncbi:MAG TPA: sigma-70 family RNA polymerase sigma factor [Chthonomonadaceae bacterium]|nr:sigma-70 family RNA polymerase sigma factor [Chthonomonadaceae bacterium]
MSDRRSSHSSRFQDQVFKDIRIRAYFKARKAGLSYDDAQDCAQLCAKGIWQAYEAGHISLSDLESNDALISHCIGNYVKNAIRDHRRRQGHMVLDTELGWEEGDFPDPQDPHRSPENEVYRKDMRERIRNALAPLSPRQFDFFWRYYIREETLAEIAQATGSTYSGIYKAFVRLNRRLPGLLAQAGLTLEECCDHLRLWV